MQFTFNEGHIQLPSQWQDQSMQVLVSTDNSGINLVITREAVPQGTLTPELYQETLALYQGKLDGYTEHACREITLAEAPAWLLDYSWNGPEDEGNQGRISQIAVFQRRGDTLLTFTFSTSLSLKNSQKTMLLEVIKSFTPLPPENDIQKDGYPPRHGLFALAINVSIAACSTFAVVSPTLPREVKCCIQRSNVLIIKAMTTSVTMNKMTLPLSP